MQESRGLFAEWTHVSGRWMFLVQGLMLRQLGGYRRRRVDDSATPRRTQVDSE